jgi:hypothetical protein
MIGRRNRSTRKKPAPVPLCPPQTPHPARMRTRAAAVGSQRLTAELRHGLSEHVDLMPSEDGQVTETCKGNKCLQIESHWTELTIFL